MYGAECWQIKKAQAQKMMAVEMRMFRLLCDHTRIRNEVIRDKVEVALIEDKMQEARLQWF